jgi:protein-S-isoprenylcysteine O-methyltransferase Ste14
MALLQSMEKQGNFLFKYRGQFPVILFILAVPFIYLTDYNSLSEQSQTCFMYTAIILSSIGFLVRFYTIGTAPQGTSGRNTKEQVATVLNSTGMYSLLRHPLYLGNYLIWLGIAVVTFNVYFVVIMSLLFWLYYERIMFAEERFLEGKFGEAYLNWSNTLPAFIPALLNFKKSDTPFSIITVLRREYASMLAAVIGFVFVEGVRNYFFYPERDLISGFSLQFLVGTAIIVFVLRSLKHYTHLLNEKGRS